MRKSFILYVHTGTDLHRVFGYKTTIDDNNDIVTKGILTSSEYAFAKILRYIYERYNGWPKNFQFINDEYGNIESPGMFGGLGGPTEIPTPNYMTEDEAILRQESLMDLCDDTIEIESVETIMETFNKHEDAIIESIKYRKDMREKLINKVINTWNISSDGVKIYFGIEKYDKNDLC